MGELLEEMARDPQVLVKIATELRSLDTTSGYLPWDKIRFKSPPRGLTHRQWWFALKVVRGAITSSQLEGAATSRQVAKEMIRSGRSPHNKSERMILNNYNAMRFVGSIRDRELTPKLVCEVHRIVTEETLDDPAEAGRIQSDPDPSARVAVFGDGLRSSIDHHPSRPCANACGTSVNSLTVPMVIPTSLRFCEP